MKYLKANPLYFGLVALAVVFFLIAIENVDNNKIYFSGLGFGLLAFACTFFVKIKLPKD